MQFRGGMNELMRQAARMQRRIDQAKTELKEREIEVEGLGGKVKVVVNLGRSVKRIDIDKETLKTEELDLVLDGVCAAMNQGIEQADKQMEAEIEKVTGGVKIPGNGLTRGAARPVSPKVRRLVKLLSRLPGVGEKTAQRYVLWLLTADDALSRELGAELASLRDELGPCERCGNVAEIRDGHAVCDVCGDTKRDAKVLCVVARVHDLMAIERAGSMRGRYFVLGRLLSPLEGIGPEDLPIGKLVERIRSEGVTEVIVATPPSVDGEATALLLEARARVRWASRSRASPAAFRTAAIWSSPIPSRWVARCRAGARCRAARSAMSDAMRRSPSRRRTPRGDRAVLAGGARRGPGLPQRADPARPGDGPDRAGRHRGAGRARARRTSRRSSRRGAAASPTWCAPRSISSTSRTSRPSTRCTRGSSRSPTPRAVTVQVSALPRGAARSRSTRSPCARDRAVRPRRCLLPGHRVDRRARGDAKRAVERAARRAGGPVPIVRPSTRTTGRSSRMLDVTKTSSAP